MKKQSLALFILFVLSAGAAIYKINTLKSEVSDLAHQIGTLTSELNTTKAKERSCTEKTLQNKKRMISHRQALTAKNLQRAKLKLAKTAAGFLPVTGVATEAVFTANDIHQYCEDVKEFRELEVSLYGASEVEISEDEKRLCAYDAQKELLPALKDYSDDSADWIKEHYHDIKKDTDKLIDKWF